MIEKKEEKSLLPSVDEMIFNLSHIWTDEDDEFDIEEALLKRSEVIKVFVLYGKLVRKEILKEAAQELRSEIIDRMNVEDCAILDVEDGRQIQRAILLLDQSPRLKVH